MSARNATIGDAISFARQATPRSRPMCVRAHPNTDRCGEDCFFDTGAPDACHGCKWEHENYQEAMSGFHNDACGMGRYS